MSLTKLMPHLATLERGSVLRGISGAQATTTYAIDTAATLVPCSIQPASARSRVTYQQQQMLVTHTLYFDQDWAPNLRDRWVFAGRYFVVHGWYASLEINDTWTCDCEEVRLP